MATLPTPARNWNVQAAAATAAQQASAQTTNARVLRLIVSSGVTLGAWTVDYSCNGPTAGVKGDGVNRWVADANVPGANPGTNHAWMVLTPFFGGGQLCFDRDSSSDGAGSAYWSPSVGFTGGSSTLRPTAADEREITPGINWLSTTNGTHTIRFSICTTTNQEAIRFVADNSAVAAGPVTIFSYERPGTQVAAWTNPLIARWMGGAGTFGNRGDWAGNGWVAVVAGTTRVMLVDNFTAQSATDPDGDRLLEPTGLSNVTLGRIGWVDDWYFVDDAAVANLATFSDTTGVRGYIAHDECVFPWDNTTDPGAGNITGAKIHMMDVRDLVDPFSYTMRAFNTNLTQYVYWTVSGAPDTTGSSSPYSPSDLTGIVIARKIHPAA